MKQSLTDEQLKQARIDPSQIFSDPMSVVDQVGLTSEQKIEILRRWEYDAKEMQVAVEEGFPDNDSGELLDSVMAALHKLGAISDLKHSPPTKQGGV